MVGRRQEFALSPSAAGAGEITKFISRAKRLVTGRYRIDWHGPGPLLGPCRFFRAVSDGVAIGRCRRGPRSTPASAGRAGSRRSLGSSSSNARRDEQHATARRRRRSGAADAERHTKLRRRRTAASHAQLRRGHEARRHEHKQLAKAAPGAGRAVRRRTSSCSLLTHGAQQHLDGEERGHHDEHQLQHLLRQACASRAPSRRR